VNEGIDLETIQRAYQCRQIAHVGGDHVGALRAGDFLDVIAIVSEVEENDLIARVDGLSSGMAADQTGAGDEHVHRNSS
jgi:GrpB-like predicted nucleotidyltransferase (UPF0157 family)